jgi:hypothetical protein
VDVSGPHPARVWNYWLGGRDFFPADRAAADHLNREFPHLAEIARAERAFLVRAVRYLAGPARIRQFLDIGAGLPAGGNTHEIAQRVAPDTGIVYADNDPVVLAHARALLADEQVTFVAEGDLRDPEGILANPDIRKYLDWDRPIGLLLCGILHYVLDEENPAEVMAALYDALPPGSYVFIHHLLDTEDPATATLQEQMRSGVGRAQFRTMAQIRSLFNGLELVEPGLVLVPDWRPEPPAIRDHPVLEMACVGVARKR